MILFVPTNASLVRSITTCLSPSNLCRGVSLLSTGRANATFKVLIRGRKLTKTDSKRRKASQQTGRKRYGYNSVSLTETRKSEPLFMIVMINNRRINTTQDSASHNITIWNV